MDTVKDNTVADNIVTSNNMTTDNNMVNNDKPDQITFDRYRKERLRDKIENIKDKQILKKIYCVIKEKEEIALKNAMKNNYGVHIYFHNLSNETYYEINKIVQKHEQENNARLLALSEERS